MAKRVGEGIDRRDFLKGSVLVAASPAVFIKRSMADYDVAIVGAGAAGLAAARRLEELGRSFVVVEAMDRIGGRAHTDHSIFGVPYDTGAHWLHNGDRNVLRDYAISRGFTVYPNSNGGTTVFGSNGPASPLELAQLVSSLSQISSAISEAGQQGLDVSAAEVAPQVNSWDATVERLSSIGSNFERLSTLEYASVAGGEDWLCAEGFGTVLGDFGARVPVQLSTPVTRIDWGGGDVRLETATGTITARTAIVTASTALLASGKIAFDPVLPAVVLEALEDVPLVRYNHTALQFSENVFGEGADHFVLPKAESFDSIFSVLNIGDSTLTYANQMSGRVAAALEKEAPEVAVDLAVSHLTDLYGREVSKKLIASDATRWGQNEWTLGAWSQARPGRAGSRQTLREEAAIGDRVFLAGEALHPDMFSTVAGAAINGRHTAEQVDAVLLGGTFRPLAATGRGARSLAPGGGLGGLIGRQVMEEI